MPTYREDFEAIVEDFRAEVEEFSLEAQRFGEDARRMFDGQTDLEIAARRRQIVVTTTQRVIVPSPEALRSRLARIAEQHQENERQLIVYRDVDRAANAMIAALTFIAFSIIMATQVLAAVWFGVAWVGVFLSSFYRMRAAQGELKQSLPIARLQ